MVTMSGGNNKIKVIIADDHAVVREGTRKILDQEEDIHVLAEASNGEEAVKLAGDLKPDVILMDISMPVMDGIEATKIIKENNPAITILILTAYDDDQFIFSLLEAGAAGYLLKNIHHHELVEAIRSVYSGESVLHPSVARKVLNRFGKSGEKSEKKALLEPLSEREMEVLKLVTKGHSNKEIADQLYLSIRTVQGHLGNIFNKLMVSSRTEAVVRALKEGWVTLDDIP
jgi:two-component system, NarL family, response regulator LiaR